MTQEEKQLLLADICARLPYNVIVDDKAYVDDKIELSPAHIYEYFAGAVDLPKPYIRPMSSMTEEERNEYNDICQCRCHEKSAIRLTTLCYSHHLDINGLIEKGLALEAPADMYC